MKELLLFLCQKLGVSADAASYKEDEKDGLRVIKLTVAEGNLDRIAGREQRTAKAIRALLSAAAAAANVKVQIEINEA